MEYFEACESVSENFVRDNKTVVELNIKDPSPQSFKSPSRSIEKSRKSPTNKNEKRVGKVSEITSPEDKNRCDIRGVVRRH